MPAGPLCWGWRLWLTLAVVSGGAAWGTYAWYRHRPAIPVPPPPPALPRFLNTQPGVAYVGSQRCGQCHTKEAMTYAEHPMGRSVSPPNRWLPGQLKADGTFDASGLHYAVERRGDSVWHREALPRNGSTPAVEIAAEIAFTIGSGQQGQSYIVNRDGRFFQSPISWLVSTGRWDLSPGYRSRSWHFKRRITETCLFCHCNEAHGKEGTLNAFEPKSLPLQAIGCERCHGPGQLHVAAHEGGGGETGPDRTIVNPSRLTPQLREAVCEQCHLQGEARVVRPGVSLWSYRPGLRLERFVTVFVTPPHSGGSKSVSHVEQMHQSRCFQAGSGRLGCISCHDPHVLPAEGQRVAWYRSRCLKCHEESACSLPIEERRRHTQADSCIECHMPRGDSSNIAHASITDHRIVRRPIRAAGDHSNAEGDLVPFHFNGGGDLAVRRDLGLALVEMIERTQAEEPRRLLARQASFLLRPVVERQPEDVAACESLGLALWKDKQFGEALDRLEKVLQRASRRESALQTAGLVALDMKDAQRSIAYWDRLLALDPYSWQAHAYRGQSLAMLKQWGEAADACGEALRLDPFEPLTRMLRIDCLIEQGQRQRAREEFEILLALRHAPPDQIRKWFDGLMNGGLPKKK
jgi:hypothetical protein